MQCTGTYKYTVKITASIHKHMQGDPQKHKDKETKKTKPIIVMASVLLGHYLYYSSIVGLIYASGKYYQHNWWSLWFSKLVQSDNDCNQNWQGWKTPINQRCKNAVTHSYSATKNLECMKFFFTFYTLCMNAVWQSLYVCATKIHRQFCTPVSNTKICNKRDLLERMKLE